MKPYHASNVQPFGDDGILIAGDGHAGKQCVVFFNAQDAAQRFNEIGGHDKVLVNVRAGDFSNPVWDAFREMVGSGEN